MKIHHPGLDVTEHVKPGLAGVLIEEGGWEPVDEADYQKKVEEEKEEEEEESGPPGMSRAEALKKPRAKKAPAKKSPAKKETD